MKKNEREFSALAQIMQEYLDCPCRYFPPMQDGDTIQAAYQDAREQGARDGFIPMLVAVDDTLWECLKMNSDKGGSPEESYTFRSSEVALYRKAVLSSPVKDGKAVIAEMTDVRKVEAQDDDMDWDEEVLGEMSGGEANNSFMGYWDYSTQLTVPVLLAEIPVKNPWEVFAYLPFGGWNECPGTPALMAVTKYWYERYCAVPAAMTHDVLEFTVSSPVPKDQAMELALEQYSFCPDVEDGSEEGIVGTLADSLWRSKMWFFWWD